MIFFYKRCFKNHIASSENYIMYLLSLHDEYKNIINKQITGEDWSQPENVENEKYENRGRRPKTYDILDNTSVHKFLDSKFLFARKFTKKSNISNFINI